jgi:quinohemoprotein ethanol dehydrogenase
MTCGTIKRKAPIFLRFGAAALVTASVAVTPRAGSVDASTIMAFETDGSEWPSNGGGYAEQRFSPLDQINRGNVKQLGFAWQADLNATRGVEATPIVAAGVLYVSSTWSQVFAFDAATGRELWRYQPKIRPDIVRVLCCDVVNRGVAVWKGRVYVGTLDGKLVALDAATGKVSWEVDTIGDLKGAYSITGAPRVIRDKVIIGNGGADIGARGFVTAYDTATGKQLWRFYVVPNGPNDTPETPDVAAAMKTWPSDPIWRGGGGGTAWDAMAYDPQLNLVYIGTGNGGPWKNQRPDDRSDDLYVACIVALNLDTGRVVWHYQVTPGDHWDLTATNQMILADLRIGGKPRKVIMQAPKNGFFYILDRKTGELLSAEKYGATTWASRVDMKTGRPVVLEEQPGFRKDEDRLMYPTPNGAHDWQALSYSPQTGLVYIPAQNLPRVISKTKSYAWDLDVPPDLLARLTAGQPHVVNGGFLRAWDPVRQRLKWEVKLGSAWNGGVLATAGGLVFQATQDGYFTAYDAANGEVLVRLFTGSSAIAPPVTYRIGGTQYIAVAAGLGGSSGGWAMAQTAAARIYENNGRMIVFKLGGGPVPLPPRRPTPKGPPRPDVSAMPPADPSLMAQGAVVYRRCAGCHGRAGSTPNLPNLERVHEIGPDGFRAIVLGGALETAGMPSFQGRLTESEVKALYEYVARGEHNKPGNAYWY